MKTSEDITFGKSYITARRSCQTETLLAFGCVDYFRNKVCLRCHVMTFRRMYFSARSRQNMSSLRNTDMCNQK